MTTKTPRGKGRRWVALHVSWLGDTDLILAGQAARGLVPLLLSHSAEQGLEGRVPADPRHVQLFAHYDDGVAAVTSALAALRELRFLVQDPDGDDGFLFIRNWATYQADFGGSTTRSENSTRSQLARRHDEGKHEDAPREGCERCAADALGLATPEYFDEAGSAKPANLPALELTIRAVCDRICEQETKNGSDLTATYRLLYERASTEVVTKYGHVPGVTGEFAAMVVVRHVAENNWRGTAGKAFNGRTLAALGKLQQAHGVDLVDAMLRAAAADKPLPYTKAILGARGAGA